MDWLTAVVECIKALVWPAVVGVLIVSQREPIGKLISGLKPKSAEGWGGKIDFDQKIDRVEDKVEAAKEELIWPPKPDLQLNAEAVEHPAIEAPSNEAKTRWQTALVDAFHGDNRPVDIEWTWNRIEKLLEELLNEDIDVPPLHTHPSVKRMLKLAADTDAIPPSVVDAIQELYSLRNKVVHTGYDVLTYSEAKRFADSARTVEAMLEFFLAAARKVRAGEEAALAKTTTHSLFPKKD